MARETREVWAKRVARWQDSGLTSTEFAAEVGINPRTLAYWKWRLGADEARKERPQTRRATGRSRPPCFVEVVRPAAEVMAAAGAPVPAATPTPGAAPVPAATPTPGATPSRMAGDEPLEIILREGLRIRVPVRFNAEALRRVVAALKVAP
jgi:hypothetical protein